MAIHVPGERFRYSHFLRRRRVKRGVVVVLSLTAMVDMFTVLVIFLLQSYNSTGQVIFIPKEIVLPKASNIKELKPAVVVTISQKEVLIDKTHVISFQELQAQQEWLIPALQEQVKQGLEVAKVKYESQLKEKLKQVIQGKDEAPNPNDIPEWNKVTVQADKGTDFLTVKKVMYTVTEAGAGEINFAVTKEKLQN